MSGNPNHDDKGRFSESPGGGAAETARKAIDWVKSPEAMEAVKKLAAPERVKAAATFAIQGALFKMGGVSDSGIDVMIRNQVDSLANDLQVTRTHARQIALAVVRKMLNRKVD